MQEESIKKHSRKKKMEEDRNRLSTGELYSEPTRNTRLEHMEDFSRNRKPNIVC